MSAVETREKEKERGEEREERKSRVHSHNKPPFLLPTKMEGIVSKIETLKEAVRILEEATKDKEEIRSDCVTILESVRVKKLPCIV